MTFPHRKARSCPLLDGDCMTPHRDSSAKECRSPSFNIDSDEGIGRTHCDGDVGHLRGPGDIARGGHGFTRARTSQSLHANCCPGRFGDGGPCLQDDGPHQRPLEGLGNATLPALSMLGSTWTHFGKFDDT